MSAGKPMQLVVNGWTIFSHPLFLSQIEALTQQFTDGMTQDFERIDAAANEGWIALKKR